MSRSSPVTETDFHTMSDPELLNYCGADAHKWAEAFCRIKEMQGWGATDIDEGLMIGWFANAIEHASHVRGLAQTPAVTAGWKLVPERPTQRQMDAGLYQSSADSTYGDVYSIYADMIDAAPSIDDHPSEACPVARPAVSDTSTDREGK